MQLRTALFKLIILTTGIKLKADAVARTHRRLSGPKDVPYVHNM